MKILVMTMACLSMSACSMFKKPVPAGLPEWPRPAAELLTRCQDLGSITADPVSIQDFTNTVVENYTLYYQCANRVDGWQKWYEKNKSIYDTLRK